MKFKAKETSNLQQAMYWVNAKPLLPGINQHIPQKQQEQQQLELKLDPLASTSSSDATADTSSSSSIGSDVASSSTSSSTSSSSQQLDLDQLDPWAKELSALNSEGLRELSQRALRLSFAALQVVPESSDKEQMQLIRKKVTAMETSSTLERLELTLQVMSQSRALLAAKCALKSLNIGAS
jgi:hypothetical protein